MSTAKNKTASAQIDALIAIWQRVLQLPAAGPDDNFFEMGGDSATALELFNAIAQTFGRDLPPVTIYQAPTIAALASLLEQPSSSRFPPLVLLKPGSQSPPVFITHGLGGSVIDFYQVVKHIESAHPIHGMQARGVDGVEAPFDRIEDMALYYLDAVRELQPRGPYYLVGYSLGGLVTLEMAQRLSAQGERVALLAMLDAYPHVRWLAPRQRAHLVLQRTKREGVKLLQLPVRAVLSQLVHPSERSAAISGDPFQSPVGPPPSAAVQLMRDCAYRALEQYRPCSYKGKIRFVRAGTTVGRFPQDPAAVWGDFADKLEVDTVAGDHLGIMTSHAADLASVLSRYIREASQEDPATSGECV